MVECWLPYGKTEVHISVGLKNLLGIVEIKAQVAAEPEKEILASIQNPIDAKRLTEFAGKGKQAALALDGDLPSPYIGFAAEQVITELLAAGVLAENLSVIVSPGAAGTIRGDLQEQLNPLGRFNVRVAEHSWSQGEVKEAGSLLINKYFLEADIRVVLGEVKPDPVAGYSGGASILFPGLAHIRSIEPRLRRSFAMGSRLSVLEGNPVYEASKEAIGVVGVDFAVNIVSDPRGQPIKVFAGALERSWRSAVEFAEKTYTTQMERGEVVVVSAGGYPYDRTLYLASRAVENIASLRRREGAVILLAECSEGYGDPSFYRYMAEYRDLKNMERALREKWTMGGEAAYHLRRVLEGSQLVLVSMIPDNTARALDIKVSRTASDALSYVNKRAGKELKAVVVPCGSVTIPHLKA
jgi:nickel-dependent lactate racemase